MSNKGIPKDWQYKRVFSHRVIGIFPVYKQLPVAWVVEGTSQIQCLCPYCEYGEGYNEPITAVFYKLAILQCKVCNTEFYGMTL